LFHVKHLVAAALALALASCARGQVGGELRGDLGSKPGLAAISASAGAIEAVFRFDLQLFDWSIGMPPK
jgi:hypothetical protein